MNTAFLIILLVVLSPFACAQALMPEPLRITSLRVLADGTMQLEVSGEPNSMFYVERSSDLKIWEGLNEAPPSEIFISIRFYLVDERGKASAQDRFPSVSPAFYRLHFFQIDYYGAR
jgi:hypothetical protein